MKTLGELTIEELLEYSVQHDVKEDLKDKSIIISEPSLVGPDDYNKDRDNKS